MSEDELNSLPFGVIKLNADGNILSFNHAEEEFSQLQCWRVINRNFFTEIAPCTQVREFKGRYADFLSGSKPSEQFSFTYHFADGDVFMKVLLIRASPESAFIVSKKIEE